MNEQWEDKVLWRKPGLSVKTTHDMRLAVSAGPLRKVTKSTHENLLPVDLTVGLSCA